MPEYKVVYFNGRGRGEIIRQVFALAGEKFEDYRLKEGEWATFKPTAPFGQAPILQIDGVTALGQSLTIARYLARKFDLAGKTEMDQANVDMIVDCVEDFIKPLMAVFGQTTEEGKAAIKKKFAEEQMPTGLEKFDKLLAASKSGFFVGDEITWCDLYFSIRLDGPKAMGVDLDLAKYPNIAAFKKKVDSNERIAAWIAARPQSTF